VTEDFDELARRACRGDANAFAEWASAEQARLYRIAYAHLRSEHDALEAVQETVYRAFKHIRKLREPGYMRTWVTRILLHYCLDELKRRTRTRLHTEREMAVAAAGGIEPSLFAERQGEGIDVQAIAVRMAIDGLSPASKQMIILKYLEDMTIVQIAALLELPEGTVKTRLHRALQELRQDMNEEEAERHVQWAKG